LQDLFNSQEAIPTSTELATRAEVQVLDPTEQDDSEKINPSPTSSDEWTTTPSITPSYTTSSTVTQSLTPSVTFTYTFVYIPPTNTQIPATNTRIPPSNTEIPPTNTQIPSSNTPIPPSATPKLTDTQVTEPPTQEPSEEPTTEPTEELVCYILTLSHVGQGTDPVANPKYSQGCPVDQYIAGQIITLSHAIPDANWEIDGWVGTLSNNSTADNNRVKMPAGDHTAKVIYGKCG